MSKPEEQGNSYSRIMKASSLIGGSEGASLLIGMVRIKFVAMLIGPVGLGLLATYQSIIGLVGTLAGLGIQLSGVRDVAESFGQGDMEKFGRTTLSLRRICWLTGSLGALLVVLFSHYFSVITFNSDAYTLPIALLGFIILFGNIQEGQVALIQGTRRIGDLARLKVIGSAVGSVISVLFYFFLGLKGIVPALISLSFFNLMTSWWFSRKIVVPRVKMNWAESIQEAGGMIRLGIAFMWSGLLFASVAYVTRILIIRELDMVAVGIFSAAFTLSGAMVNFILVAMGADYYPSLTAVSQDKVKMCKLVNEQTEIGLLLAAPCLIYSIIFVHYIIKIFYSSDFSQAENLFPWFVLGCLGQVISWPMGFILRALGAARIFVITETTKNVIHIILIWSLLLLFGIEGVSIAFFLLYCFYTVIVLVLSRCLIGFFWSPGVVRLLIFILPAIGLVFLSNKLMPIIPAAVISNVVAFFTSVYCLRQLVIRLGPAHKISQTMRNILFFSNSHSKK